MAHQELATYLNDHFAGSLAGVELAKYLERGGFGDEVSDTAAALRLEIAADRDVLEGLIRSLGFAPSGTRQAATWLMKKAAELKARWDDPSARGLGLLEMLEALSLGIEGKAALWSALASVDDGPAALKQLDYGRLLQRAHHQRARLESLRLMSARLALSSTNGRSGNVRRDPRLAHPRMPADGQADRPIDRSTVAIAQGAYFVATGVWPLVHMRSFETVTGPKTDKWLVRTVGVLVSVIGATLVWAGTRRSVNGDTVRLATGAAAGLAAIDATYATRGRISRLYIADAALEACFVGAWTLAEIQRSADDGGLETRASR
jgi:hypothetical protein